MNSNLKDRMSKTITSFEKQLNKLSINKPSSSIVKDLTINYQNHLISIGQAANISLNKEGLEIEPWDKSLIKEIELALHKININFRSTKTQVYVIITPPSEEKRIEIAKNMKKEYEKYKLSLEKERKKSLDEVKKIKDLDQKQIEKEKIESISKKFASNLKNILENSVRELLCNKKN